MEFKERKINGLLPVFITNLIANVYYQCLLPTLLLMQYNI